MQCHYRTQDACILGDEFLFKKNQKVSVILLPVIISNPNLSSVDKEVKSSNPKNRTGLDNKSGIEGETISSAKSGFPPENSLTNFRQSGEKTIHNTNCFCYKSGHIATQCNFNIYKLHVIL